MKTKVLELTKEEAINLSMAYRNEVNKFNLNFKDFDNEGLKTAGKEYWMDLRALQNKLEKFISEFE